MKTDLLRRVERMEAMANPAGGYTAIFWQVVDVEDGRPVKALLNGWRFDAGPGGQVDVLRRPGENDDDLSGRAITMAREHGTPGKMPWFVSI